MAATGIISSLFSFGYSGFEGLLYRRGVESDTMVTQRMEAGPTALTESTDRAHVALPWISALKSALSGCMALNALSRRSFSET